MSPTSSPTPPYLPPRPQPAGNAPVLVVVAGSDDTRLGPLVAATCAFLEVEIVRVSGAMALRTVLRQRRPIGVLAEAGPQAELGCATVKAVASYDPALPVMMVTGGDPDVLGTLDVIEELSGAQAVTTMARPPAAADLLSFLAVAGRRTGAVRLLAA